MQWLIRLALTLLLGSLIVACVPQEAKQPQPVVEQPKQRTAQFEVGVLSISPTLVVAGEPMVVTANITNVGDEAGIYKAVLFIDGQEFVSKDISLLPGQSSTAEFIINDLIAGKRAIAVGESIISIDVLPKPTKIAFGRYTHLGDELWVMDSDGGNVVPILVGGFYPSWSPNGTKIAFEYYGQAGRCINTMDADGKNVKNITPAFGKVCQFPSWSPDGKKIAYSSARTSGSEFVCLDIYVMNPDGTDNIEVASSAGTLASCVCPKWFPDSKRIAYVNSLLGVWQICSVNVDGTETVRYNVSTNAQGGRFPSGRFPFIDVSPDGTQIAFDYAGLFNRTDICIFNINTGEVKNLTKGFGDTNRFPTWSPDGKKLAFTSLGTEVVGIYVMDADGSNITLLCAGAYFPVWQR